MTTPASANNANFKSVAVRGSIVVIISQLIRIALIFASTVVLSRLLDPEDFGLVACLTPIVLFITMLQDAGLQQAVVQRDNITPEQVNRVFWIMAAIGVGCSLLLGVLSPGIAWFYHDDRLIPLALFACLPLIMTCIAALPVSLLNRHLQFKQIAMIDASANIAGFIGTVIGAWAGMSYWSLMMTPLIIAMVTMGGALWASGWRPSRPDFKIEADIFKFGANLTGFNFVSFFSRNLDNILIGRYLGEAPLGFYDRAYKLLMFPLIALNAPLARVIIPILSRVQDDLPRMRRIYLRVVGLLTLAAVPGMAALMVIPEPVILFLFGEKWLPVVPIFCWLGLAALVQPLNSSSGWLFIAQGKTSEMFRWGIFSSLISIASFVVGLRWGAVGVAAAYALTESLIKSPALYWYMNRVGPVNAIDYMRVQIPLLIAAAAVWPLTRFGLQGELGLSGLTLIIATVAVSYALAVSITALHSSGRRVLAEAFTLFWRAIKGDVLQSHIALIAIKWRMRRATLQKQHKLQGQLIVSLTSYKPRFATLLPTLQCLLTQSVKPDRVILWITPEDMPHLPEAIGNLKMPGFEIRTYHNVKSFKKIIPTLELFPEAYIVTADDDVYYPSNWLETLISSWSGDPKQIVCHRAHRIKTRQDGSWESYSQWDIEIEGPVEGMDIFATGIGGIFYPPHVFSPEVLDEALYLKLCPHADDVWLYWMARRKGAIYKKVPGKGGFVVWHKSQGEALSYNNVANAANDKQIKAIAEHFGWPALS